MQNDFCSAQKLSSSYSTSNLILTKKSNGMSSRLYQSSDSSMSNLFFNDINFSSSSKGSIAKSVRPILENFPKTRKNSQTYFRLKFVPKRSLQFPKPNQPLKINTPSNSLNLDKTLFEFGRGINDQDYLRFRNEYIFNYAKCAEKVKHFPDYFYLLNERRAKLSNEAYTKVKKGVEEKTNLFFNVIAVDEKITFVNWKKMVSSVYEVFKGYNSLLKELIDEFKEEKEKTTKLNNKLFEQNTKLNFYSTSVEKMNNIMKKNEKLLEMSKEKRNKKEEEKNSYNKTLNDYRIEINRLEGEIRDLTILLEKNQDYYNMYKKTKELLDSKIKLIEDMKSGYTAEINDMQIKLAVRSNEISELNTKIIELQKLNDIQTEKIDNSLRDNMNDKLQAQKMRILLEQDKENFNMMKEDMDMWQYLYDVEKNEHMQTLSLLKGSDIKKI